MRSATVRRWLKEVGDSVHAKDVIVEIETEVGLILVEAPISGRLARILIAEGKSGPMESPLAVIDVDGLPGAEQAESGAIAGVVIPIPMPKAGQSMEEGTITRWLVEPGAVLTKGQPIFEIETDKAVMEVDAPESGRLARIVVAEGGVSPVQVPVAYIADTDADVDAFLASLGRPPITGAVDEGKVAPALVKSEDPSAPRMAGVPTPSPTGKDGRVRASPAARKLANERGVDLGRLPLGTGPGGRIMSSDVPLASEGPVSRKKISGMRKAIAKSLVKSKQSIPHFYVRLTIDAGPLLEFYRIRKEETSCSLNDVIVFACARLLKEFPAFRSRLEDEDIVESPQSNIGIAVGIEDGLVVPVLEGAEQMSLAGVASATKRLIASAHEGKVENMGKGSFTITNLGMFGTEEFAAIINPPEAGILAIGAAREGVIVTSGTMKAGKLMTMTLSADHRLVDGMLAAKFLARLKKLLEAPASISG